MLNLNSVCCAQGFPGNLGLDRGNCEVGVPSAEAEGLLDHYGIAVPFEAGPSWQRSRCPVSVWVSEVVKWGWSSGSGACRASRVEGSQLAGAQRVGDDLGHSDPHVPVLQQPVLLSWPPGGVTAPRDLAGPARAPPLIPTEMEESQGVRGVSWLPFPSHARSAADLQGLSPEGEPGGGRQVPAALCGSPAHPGDRPALLGPRGWIWALHEAEGSPLQGVGRLQQGVGRVSAQEGCGRRHMGCPGEPGRGSEARI